MLLYIAQEGSGIGLLTSFAPTSCRSRASTPTRRTSTSASPPSRDYGIGAQILADLGLTTIRSSRTIRRHPHGISGFGPSVVSQSSIVF